MGICYPNSVIFQNVKGGAVALLASPPPVRSPITSVASIAPTDIPYIATEEDCLDSVLVLVEEVYNSPGLWDTKATGSVEISVRLYCIELYFKILTILVEI